MKLAELTWQEVQNIDLDTVVVIPTGATEQHGAHLPLFTDTYLSTAISEGLESKIGSKVLLTPGIWLGASAHHMAFSGTITASSCSYNQSLRAIIESLAKHGFWKFVTINGHGGNTPYNKIVLRELKYENPKLLLANMDYWDVISHRLPEILDGKYKSPGHACEFETSLMMYLYPNLVKQDKLRTDGLMPDSQLMGLITDFEEISEEGSFGASDFATPEKGRILYQEIIEALEYQIRIIEQGVVYA